MSQFLKIVPNKDSAICQGTKVVMPDGTQVPGVFKIELVAERDSLWSAVIHCHAQVDEITAAAEIVTTPVIPSDEVSEVTDLGSTSRKYIPGKKAEEKQ